MQEQPVSVTMPTVCDDPRSPSLVTTAGLMSIQTTRTADGSMLPTPMPCSMLASMSTIDTSFEALRVAILRRDEIHHRFRQRAVVANASGQDVRRRRAFPLVENPALDDPLLHRLANAADPADRVDRAHVVMVSALDRPPGFEIDAERCAEQRSSTSWTASALPASSTST